MPVHGLSAKGRERALHGLGPQGIDPQWGEGAGMRNADRAVEPVDESGGDRLSKHDRVASKLRGIELDISHVKMG